MTFFIKNEIFLDVFRKKRQERKTATVKKAYFSSSVILEKSTCTVSKWAQLYMTEIVRLHGVLVSIVYDRDAYFTSKFWKGLQAAMGTRLDFSITVHPQTDG